MFLCSLVPAQSQTDQNTLPDGAGKQIAQTACVQCHELGRLTNPNGHTPEEWQDVVKRMVWYGASITEDQITVLIEYLANSFPDRAPKAVVIPGSVEVSIHEWTVPTPYSRPHDPLVAPDGFIWYTGIDGNLLGRFNPNTNQFKEYALKTPKSRPHGPDFDQEGNIWFTAINGGYVGKLNPITGEVDEYPMPDPNARGPHTPIFDQNGTLWFTLSGDNMVGRLIPETGEVKLVRVPTDNARPYGIVVNSKLE